MIAALPMYERPETVAVHGRFWALIRDGLRERGCEAPDALTRGGDVWEIWQSPDLVLAQTCGLPYRARLHDRVTLIGTPDYGLPDAPPGHYCSVLVARQGETPEIERARLAYNEALSQSGWAAALTLAGGRSYAGTLETGAHRESARAVAEGRADLAALDAVTWRLMERFEPDLTARLHVITRSPATPGLPLIAGPDRDTAAGFEAVAAAIDALDTEDRELLGLTGLVAIPKSAYLALPLPPAP